MAKKATHKSKVTKKTNRAPKLKYSTNDQDFLIITGGGFIVIALLMVFILR